MSDTAGKFPTGRALPKTANGRARLIGTLEAVEIEARRLAREQPHDPRLTVLRYLLKTVDRYDAYGYDDLEQGT
jgi:hypothetical protein